jgi:tRNA-Thr(GGU) m(6)t(6)A37 methyltransferase TsaA
MEAALERFEVRPIGVIESALTDLGDAPAQGDEGAPDAWLVIDPDMSAGLEGLDVGDELIVLTWLNRASRTVLRNRPRSDPNRAEQGVFTTRAPDRPNPIGLHEVAVLGIDGFRVRVNRMDAVDGTPVLDVKPVLAPIANR